MPGARRKPTFRGRPPDPQAEHARVARALKQAMAKGAWKRYERLPPVRRLAQKFNASVSAVRLALEHLVTERVLARNARKHCVILPPGSARADEDHLVLAVLSDPVGALPMRGGMTELHRGILEGCGEIGAPLLIAHAHKYQRILPGPFLDLPLKGILLLGRFTPNVLSAYERLTAPVCYVDTPAAGHLMHAVCVANASAAYDATRGLLQAGHRRIAFVQFILFTLNDVDPDSKARKQGFLRACHEAGLPNAARNVFSFFSSRIAQASLRALLKVRPRITAVLCADPGSAQALAREAAALGLKVPQDLGIVCFQASVEPTAFSGPAIDFFTIGRQAAPLLNSPKAPALQKEVAPAWIERGSVVPLA
ncbi:MAG: substrate-binding domain-containing protein [Planctomycetota bacterium]|nr:substrate-binding domain-containing protein [Planctomycetota bacterium]